MKNKFVLLLICLIITAIGVYYFMNDLNKENYTKEFKEEMKTYVVQLNNWSETESDIAEDYNKKVVQKAGEEKVRAYDYLKTNIIERTEILKKEITDYKEKEKQTKELKEKYVKILDKQLEIYKMYDQAFEEQDEKKFEETKVKFEELKTERKKFSDEVNKIMEDLKIEKEKEK